MRIEAHTLQVVTTSGTFEAPNRGGGVAVLGPLEVELALLDATGPWTAVLQWSVANRGDAPVGVRAVALRLSFDDAGPHPRVFRNGYQSWSPTGVATFGVDRDPSTIADFPFLQAVHHADQARAMDGELRSEGVTVLVPTDGVAAGTVVAGFLGGTEHDGTFRVRPTGPDGAPELWIEAFFGGAVLAAGEERLLHEVLVSEGLRTVDAVYERLERWADAVGGRGGARVDAPYQVGWCSWYHYFHGITEDALRANLALNADWPFEVFQLDDGFQSAIGDWLTTNDKFPSGLRALAADIAVTGRQPGLWLAPFLVAPDSVVAREHPDWLSGHEKGEPLLSWWNPEWGGGRDGFMYGLDTTHPEVQSHLEHVARELVAMGFTYLKLDFTFSPSLDGVWHDPSCTPAQRVRLGYEAFRRGAGDEAFILACGAPLLPVVGLVDAMRIGQDVAPLWSLDPADAIVPGYQEVEPATQHAYGNTVTRAFMHRRLWLNDPDCLMLRQKETALAPEAMRTWARTVGVSGGMALVSDDLALLDEEARALLDATIAIGRETDAAAVAGHTPRAADLLGQRLPAHFAAAGYTLTTDPVTGTSQLEQG